MMRTAGMSGIAPEAFWRLSLKEWRMLIDRTSGLEPMGRETLARMAEAWPDD